MTALLRIDYSYGGISSVRYGEPSAIRMFIQNNPHIQTRMIAMVDPKIKGCESVFHGDIAGEIREAAEVSA